MAASGEENAMKSIETLKDTTNYEIWKFQICIFFKSKQVYDVVDGTTICPEEATKKIEWEKKDAIAQKLIITTIEKQPLIHLLSSKTSKEMFDKLCQKLIITTIEKQPLIHLLSSKTSKEMFDKLCSVYGRDTEQQKYEMLQKFYNYQYKKGMNVSTYICDIENLVYKLKALNQSIDETMLITKILSGLPESYKYFVSAWESTQTDGKTLTNLTAGLIAEENRLKADTESEQVAFKITQRRDLNKRYVNTPSNSKNINCFRCGKTKGNNGGNSSADKVTFLTKEGSSAGQSQQWILDSSTSSHMVNDKNIMKNLRENNLQINTERRMKK
ncbi:hypothetical protein QE152_g24945 [Popillia japonica]|uniref:Copia protein n=1 Tax=Popillia japonica TaxID=7064 RepID=A0AAW1K1R5_POPJA